MKTISEIYQTADWKSEKHVPVIDCPDRVMGDELFEVTVSIGEEVGHPNTTEHHIRWIQLFFLPEEETSAYQVGSFEFGAHGESINGTNSGPVYTHHAVTAKLRLTKSGTLYATALCNIHGLWQSSKFISSITWTQIDG